MDHKKAPERSGLSRFLATLCYGGLKLFGQPKGTRILCYHRVNDETQSYLNVPVQHFKDQMKFLAAHGYHTISLSDLFAGKADAKSVVITFDDGYRDNYEHAFPAMREYGFSGTIFLIAKKIGEADFLKISDIEEMIKAGFDFGSHTLTHPHLKNLSRQDKTRELLDSKIVIEKLLGLPCNSFCYPFGEYDTETLNLVKAAGYKSACSNIPGVNLELSEPHLLRRTEIAAHDSVRDFEMKMAGAYDVLHQILHKLRGRP